MKIGQFVFFFKGYRIIQTGHCHNFIVTAFIRVVYFLDCSIRSRVLIALIEFLDEIVQIADLAVRAL